MQNIYAKQSASVSELKKNPTQIIEQAAGLPVAILNHNKATAYLIPAETFEKLIEALDDQQLIEITEKRLADNKKNIKVKTNDI